MLPIIAIAQGILSATGLDDKIGDWIDGKTGGAASKVVEIAGAVMGGKPVNTMTPAQATEIKNRLLDAESEIRQLAAQDRADARQMYRETDHKMADIIADRIIKYNLPMVAALVVCNLAALVYIDDAVIGVAIGNVIGGSITYLWQERRTVIEFFFGSSQGSKDKTQAMTK